MLVFRIKNTENQDNSFLTQRTAEKTQRAAELTCGGAITSELHREEAEDSRVNKITCFFAALCAFIAALCV
jgi:hypothetical protein